MQIRQSIFLIALAAAVGCSDAASPGDLAISISTTASVVKPGEAIGVNVTVANVGDREHTFESGGCPAMFRVYELEGSTVRRDEICSAVSRPVRLVPGDSYTVHYTWTAEKVSYTGGSMVRTPLPPGEYTFRGEVLTGEFGVVSAGMTRIYIF
jgi:hypothetical protein